MTIQNWISLISGSVALLALMVTLIRGMQSEAREDGKTAEVLRQVNDKLESIERQETSNSARIESLIERVVAVEQSAKQAHKRIDELREELQHK
ncbi:hypothetical protein CAFE_17950 [Caprobacter fermentans]|uniref:Uncharacterized protein n=1 Tax=Caproicibacter fermentans TaxID=2576756 RepID=A0A6N8I0L8_9FIRM|nr:hypothetical protein [Caproicibacter fermentans]MVB11093.1 hypothetical protein [Caproicibacter fermentans]